LSGNISPKQTKPYPSVRYRGFAIATSSQSLISFPHLNISKILRGVEAMWCPD